MSTTQRNPAGPLIYSDLIRIGDVIYWGRSFVPPIFKDQSDNEHIVRKDERLDDLAHRHLQNSAMGYIIMERNAMRLWPNDFVPGRTIAIPTRRSLARRNIV